MSSADFDDEDAVLMNSFAVSRETLEEERKSFHEHTQALARRLSEQVARTLRDEIGTEIAGEWVGAARAALGTLHDDANAGDSAEMRDALAQVQRELSANFAREVLIPDDREIEEHARALAQLVWANWVALLQHAIEDLADPSQPLRLTESALPPSCASTELWEGVEAFAIDPRHLGETFLRHLDSLKESNPVIRIAHDLFVVANAQGWWACDSAAEAAKLANRVGRHDPGQDPMSSPSTSGSEPAPEAASPGDVWSLGLEPAFENRMARIVAAACLAGRTPDLGRANLPAAAIGDLTHFVVTHVFDAAPLHRIKGCRPVLAQSPEPNAERICEAIGNAMPQAWVSRLIWVSVHAAARAMALHARPGPIPDGSDLSQADYEQFSAMTTEQTRMILDCSTWIVHEALQSKEGKIVSKQVDAAFAGIEMQNSAKG